MQSACCTRHHMRRDCANSALDALLQRRHAGTGAGTGRRRACHQFHLPQVFLVCRSPAAQRDKLSECAVRMLMRNSCCAVQAQELGQGGGGLTTSFTFHRCFEFAGVLPLSETC